MRSISLQLFDKSKSALISSLEIYYKPNFSYREETFSILVLNAWELLLKAKIISDNNNDPRSIYVYEKRNTKSGELSKKEYVKRNRVGNPFTMSLSYLISTLDKESTSRLSPAIKSNLDALTEIRDNAIHFINPCPQLSKRVLEIGTASVRNFIDLAQKWFNEDFSEYNLFLMPIGFVPGPGTVSGITPSEDEIRILDYIESLITGLDDEKSKGYSVAIEIDISMKRTSGDAMVEVALSDDPDAIRVHLTEEDIRKKYPWDYEQLTERLQKRYVDFLRNKKYHSIRKPLHNDPRYVRVRFLDPGNPNSSKKLFYNPNIFRVFDRHYTRK